MRADRRVTGARLARSRFKQRINEPIGVEQLQIVHLLAESEEQRLARMAGKPAEFHYLPSPQRGSAE
jgi:hypothetical protein